MLHYLAWRVEKGYHKEIELNFMIAGHTKFGPDWFFGVFKRRFRVTFASSLQEIKDCFHELSSNKAVLVGKEDGTVLVPAYDWTTYLDEHYKTVSGLKKCHQFIFKGCNPSDLIMKSYCDSVEESSLPILLKRPQSSSFPPQIEPPGLSESRKAYLLTDIRQFCKEGTEDIVCPKPPTVKPSSGKRPMSGTSKAKRPKV